MFVVASNSSKGKRLASYAVDSELYVRNPVQKREMLKARIYVKNLVNLRTIHDSVKFFASYNTSFYNI